jgi:hypothetical protein
LHRDFGGFVPAQQDIRRTDANLQGAGKAGFADNLYTFSNTKTLRQQALAQGIIGVDGEDSRAFARDKFGQIFRESIHFHNDWIIS